MEIEDIRMLVREHHEPVGPIRMGGSNNRFRTRKEKFLQVKVEGKWIDVREETKEEGVTL